MNWTRQRCQVAQSTVETAALMPPVCVRDGRAPGSGFAGGLVFDMSGLELGVSTKRYSIWKYQSNGSACASWPLDRLRPYARNAKIHGTDQVAKIAASMAKFGWTVPCMVADDGELIAGHGRVLAATMLGLS